MEKLQAYPEITVCASAVIGLLHCFFGYRLFRLFLALTGFAIGGFMGAAVAHELTDGQTWMIVASGIGGGVVGAAAFYILHLVCVFLLGAGVGSGLTVAGFAAAGHPPHYVAMSIGATIGGLVAMLLRRPVIIVATAISGAWGVVYGALYFLGHRVSPDQVARIQQDPQAMQQVLQELPRGPYMVGLGCTLVLAVAGILVQWGSSRPKPESAEEKSEKE
ncbi:DUF4203 domain-containing protein [bacterium]|nr:DUF4203 domain-containing protein [bacterium]